MLLGETCALRLLWMLRTQDVAAEAPPLHSQQLRRDMTSQQDRWAGGGSLQQRPLPCSFSPDPGHDGRSQLWTQSTLHFLPGPSSEPETQTHQWAAALISQESAPTSRWCCWQPAWTKVQTHPQPLGGAQTDFCWISLLRRNNVSTVISEELNRKYPAASTQIKSSPVSRVSCFPSASLQDTGVWQTIRKQIIQSVILRRSSSRMHNWKCKCKIFSWRSWSNCSFSLRAFQVSSISFQLLLMTLAEVLRLH